MPDFDLREAQRLARAGKVEYEDLTNSIDCVVGNWPSTPIPGIYIEMDAARAGRIIVAELCRLEEANFYETVRNYPPHPDVYIVKDSAGADWYIKFYLADDTVWVISFHRSKP